jgi:hypothetical protein
VFEKQIREPIGEQIIEEQIGEPTGEQVDVDTGHDIKWAQHYIDFAAKYLKSFPWGLEQKSHFMDDVWHDIKTILHTKKSLQLKGDHNIDEDVEFQKLTTFFETEKDNVNKLVGKTNYEIDFHKIDFRYLSAMKRLKEINRKMKKGKTQKVWKDKYTV